jgi:F-type H+-transporting ATPase subunit delta
MSIVLSKVAEPYAQALLELAKSNNSIQETNRDISIVSSFLLCSIDLKKFLVSPIRTREAKKSVLKSLFHGKISETTLNFLMLLIDRNRIPILESVIEKFLTLSYKLKGIEIARVTSAVQLSGRQQTFLAKQLKKFTGAKHVKLAVKVDPSLIGGFTIEIGSKLIDSSIRGQLRQFANLLA